MELSITLLLVFALVTITQSTMRDYTRETHKIRMQPQFTGIKTRITSRSKSPTANLIHDFYRNRILRDQPKPSNLRTHNSIFRKNNVLRRRTRTSPTNGRERQVRKITGYSSANNRVIKPLDLHGIPTQYKSLSSRAEEYRQKYEKPETYTGNSLNYKSLQNDEVRSQSKRGVIIGGPLGSEGIYLSQPKIISRVYKQGNNEPIVTWVVGKPENPPLSRPSPTPAYAVIPGANFP